MVSGRASVEPLADLLPAEMKERHMDLSNYSFQDCLLTALKSESDATAIYNKIAERVENMFLKDRLRFLAAEEEKHYSVFLTWYRAEFDEQDPVLPTVSPVPLPEIKISTNRTIVSDVLRQAMEAENAANKFYRAMSHHYPLDDERRQALMRIASMEKSHYQLLENELEAVENFNDYTIEWPMMHVGP